MDSVFNYMSKEDYSKKIKNLKNDERRNIYKKDNVEIDVKKIGRKIYKLINVYGKEILTGC